MFLRFSKGAYIGNGVRNYRKCVFLGDAVVMEYGDRIVGVAKLHEETGICQDYDVVVAKDCDLGGAKIARYIKDMIGKSNKFSAHPSTKRRKYFVQEVDGDALPINAKIIFTKL